MLFKKLNQKDKIKQIQAAANIIKDRFNLKDFKNIDPIGIVLGSGFGTFVDQLKKKLK
jgi:purine nucleoside phosphorylase